MATKYRCSASQPCIYNLGYWTCSYLCGFVGCFSVDIIIIYVENQKKSLGRFHTTIKIVGFLANFL